MKATVLFLALLASAALGWSRDIKTLNGTVYKNVTVTRQDSTGIGITHDDGFTFLNFSQLPPGLEKEFGFDRSAYDATVAKRDAAEAALRNQGGPTPTPTQD